MKIKPLTKKELNIIQSKLKADAGEFEITQIVVNLLQDHADLLKVQEEEINRLKTENELLKKTIQETNNFLIASIV